MTIEALLRQLENDRQREMALVWSYGSRAQEAMIHDDHDDEEMYKRFENESRRRVEQLDIAIKEIKIRVS